MKNWKIKLMAVAGLLLPCVPGMAATITQTNWFSGEPSYSTVLSFDQFDDHDGTWTLDSIWISVYLQTADGAALNVDYDGANPISGVVSYGSRATIGSSDVALITTGFLAFNGLVSATGSSTLSLTADDGDGTAFSTDGTDYGQYLQSGVIWNDNAAYISSLVFAGYTGTGTYDINVDVSTIQQAFQNSQVLGANLFSSGYVGVTYTYTIPEPASAGLLGVSALVLLFIRRYYAIFG